MEQDKKLLIIRYSNDLNNLYLGDFLKVELRIWFLILLKAKNTLNGEISFCFYELKKSLGLISNNKQIRAMFDSVKLKILSQKIRITTGEKVIDFNMFSYIEQKINGANALIVKINPDFLPFFNQLVKNYVSLEWDKIENFGSKYSILLYKFLREFRNVKQRFFDWEEFKAKMGLLTFSTRYINEQVLSKAKKELVKLPEFQNLKISKILDYSTRRIKVIRFTW